MRTTRVLIPRITRKQSNGDRIAPDDFCTSESHSASSGREEISTPQIESLWPLRNLVAEWTT